MPTIVSSDAGGLPELIRDGENGLISKVDDVPGYIRAIERLIEDQPLRERLGNAARRSIEEGYTDTFIAQKSVDYFEKSFQNP